MKLARFPQQGDHNVNFPFDTKVQSFPVGATRRTEVKLGNVVMTFHGDMLYQVRNKKTGEGYYWRELPVMQLGSYEGLHKVPYQELLFHLNQMIWEQSNAIIEPIVDKAYGGSDDA